MNTLKTGVVIILLLGVSYGVYQIINAPDPTKIGEEAPLDVIQNNQQALPQTGIGKSGKDENPAVTPVLPGNEPPNADKAWNAPPLMENGASSNSSNASANSGFSGSNRFPNNAARKSNPYMNQGESGNSDQRIRNETTPGLNRNAIAGNNHPQNPNWGSPSTGDSSAINPLTPQTPVNKNGVSAQQIPHRSPPENLDQLPPLSQTLQVVSRLNSEGNLRAALEKLSPYHRRDVPLGEKKLLYEWLDYLAAEVIYSPRHHLHRPHIVQQDQTLVSLAAQWQVPPQLVLNINRAKISNPNAISPGTELKIVVGPFNAEVNSRTGELTMFLNEMYAGRFKIDIGNDARLEPGLMRVQAKSSQSSSYTDATGRMIPANDPANPYGQYWIDLGSKICIHSVSHNSPPQDRRGCIRVSYNQDAQDIFSILSENSRIKIVR